MCLSVGDKSKKLSKKSKRIPAALDPKYREKLLGL
jgi:hypothetical protein